MGQRGPGAKPTITPRRITPRRAFKLRPGGLTRADRLIRWLETLQITSGQHAGRKLRLREWQREIIRDVYATDADGTRPVRTALVSMGRKGGKSTLVAALALAHLVGPEAVPRGQVVSAAADRGQASIIYNEMKAFALANPEISGRLNFKDFHKQALDMVTGSTYAALSADARKAHGLSPVFAVCDELAQWRSRDLIDALRTGQGAHKEPLTFIISTRSPDPDSPLEELLRYAGQVKAGIITDPTLSAHVWSAPADADPWDEATWHLANPGLGDITSLEDVRVQAAQAQRLPSQAAAFRAYTLNQPVEPDTRFISALDWDACADTAEARGPCYGGLDLASGAADLSAFSLYWPDTGRLDTWAFLPSDALATKAAEDRAPYFDWKTQGHVIEIPGKAIDRAWLVQWIAGQVDGLDLAGIACDRWGLNDLQAVLDREGIRLLLLPHGAGFKDMSPSVTAFEAAVLDAKLAHGGNPLLRWSVSNVQIDLDPAGNRKPSKQRSRGRIDPAVAALTAVGLASRAPAAAKYDFTGMSLVG
jgi:phage terminase large subunit-like protein